MDSISKSRQSFYYIIILFIIIDFGVLITQVDYQFMLMTGIVMLLATYGEYVSGYKMGVSRGSAALIAIVLLLFYVGALLVKGYF